MACSTRTVVHMQHSCTRQSGCRCMSGHNFQRLICARNVGGPIRSCSAARIALQAQVPVGILCELRILQGCETYSISDTD